MTNLLPGQQLINGASNYIFGSNMPPDYGPHTVRNTPQIQAYAKNGGFTVMRCAIPANSSDAYIDLTSNACIACGCAMLVILDHGNVTWNQHLVRYLGSRCMMYEFSNEPDLANPAISWSQYLGFWNQTIPLVRAINPGASYIGPVLGVYSNVQSYLVPWLNGCKASGNLPDAISYHIYPCTGTQPQATCAAKSGSIGHSAIAMNQVITNSLGHTLPLCVTEWNLDANNPVQSYTLDPTFNATWTKQCLDSMVANGIAMACQFDFGSGAASGGDDLINVNNYQPGVQYAPMVDRITYYLKSNTSGGGNTGGGNTGSGTTSNTFTLYFTNTSSSTLSTSDQLVTTSGTPATTYSYSRVGTATGFGEIVPQGSTATWNGASTIPAPTGKGFFLDATSTLGGQQFIAGNWSAFVRLNAAQGGDTNQQAGTLVGDIYVRVYKYSSGTYTNIVSMSLIGQTINTAFTTFSLPTTAASSMTFAATDHLYIDVWVKITTNANASSIQDIRISRLSTDGSTGDTNSCVVTPGYILSSGGGSGGGITVTTNSVTVTETPVGSEIVTALVSSGVNATWTWNTQNNKLTASGGSYGVLLYNSPTSINGDVSTIMDTSDHGGLCWRYVNQLNFYDLAIHDNSAPSHAGTLYLYKTINGARTAIANSSINFVRGVPHVFKVVFNGSSVLISMDGLLLLNQSDSSLLSSGSVGLRNNGGNATFYQFRSQVYGDSVANKVLYTRVRMSTIDPTVVPQLINLSVSCHGPTIQSGAFIPSTKYSVLNGGRNTIADILKDLARQSSYWCKIKNGQLYFQNYQSQAAPWAAIATDILLSSCEVDIINDTYRNSQWLSGGTDVVSQNQNFSGNGVVQSFSLGFPVDSIVSISLDYVSQSVGIKGVDSQKDWYYTRGQSEIIQDSSAVPIESSQTLSISYQAQISVTVQMQNDDEIARMASIDGSSGIVEELEDGSGLSKISMIAKASSLLTQFAKDSISIKFTTLHSGLDVGQFLTIFLPQLSLNNETFLITQIRIVWNTTLQGGVLVNQPWYSVTAINGPVLEQYSRFFVNLIK